VAAFGRATLEVEKAVVARETEVVPTVATFATAQNKSAPSASRSFKKSSTFDDSAARSSDGAAMQTLRRWKRAETAPIDKLDGTGVSATGTSAETKRASNKTTTPACDHRNKSGYQRSSANASTGTASATSQYGNNPTTSRVLRPLSPARQVSAAAGEQRRQFSWARQFNAKFFGEIQKVSGLVLENIVYYRGPDSHYIIMTPTRASLLSVKVDLTHPPGEWKPHLRQKLTKLFAYLNIVGDFCAPPNDVMAFDFSSTMRASQSFAFKEEEFPPLALVGDALLEPFWPEGLGVIRGFLGALDCCWAVDEAFTRGEKSLLACTNQSFGVLKSICGQSRGHYLEKDEAKWDVYPGSRYKSWGVM